MKRALAALCLLVAGSAQAGPRVAIIIDDLGNRGALDRRAVALPGPVAMAVLPHTPHAEHVARRAHRAGKEILVHLPMQSQGAVNAPDGAIALHDSRQKLEARLFRALEAVPFATGVNNHQGSLITRHPGHMDWLMAALATRPGLFFVDSRTTKFTLAEKTARSHGIPALARDVFLDDDPALEAVERAFDRLVETARRRGRAIAIGHPLPATLSVLERRLPQLRELGITLIPLSDMLTSEQEPQWETYSSR